MIAPEHRHRNLSDEYFSQGTLNAHGIRSLIHVGCWVAGRVSKRGIMEWNPKYLGHFLGVQLLFNCGTAVQKWRVLRAVIHRHRSFPRRDCALLEKRGTSPIAVQACSRVCSQGTVVRLCRLPEPRCGVEGPVRATWVPAPASCCRTM